MNKARPDVTIILDKPRTLRFTLNAMCAFEEATGKNIFSNALNNLSAKEIRALLWACLTDEDPTLTIEQVGGLITLDNMTEVAEKLNEALAVAMPDKEAKETPPLASTG